MRAAKVKRTTTTLYCTVIKYKVRCSLSKSEVTSVKLPPWLRFIPTTVGTSYYRRTSYYYYAHSYCYDLLLLRILQRRPNSHSSVQFPPTMCMHMVSPSVGPVPHPLSSRSRPLSSCTGIRLHQPGRTGRAWRQSREKPDDRPRHRTPWAAQRSPRTPK